MNHERTKDCQTQWDMDPLRRQGEASEVGRGFGYNREGYDRYRQWFQNKEKTKDIGAYVSVYNCDACLCIGVSEFKSCFIVKMGIKFLRRLSHLMWWLTLTSLYNKSLMLLIQYRLIRDLSATQKAS